MPDQHLTDTRKRPDWRSRTLPQGHTQTRTVPGPAGLTAKLGRCQGQLHFQILSQKEAGDAIISPSAHHRYPAPTLNMPCPSSTTPPAGAGPSPPSAHLRMAPTGTSCCHYLTPEPDLPRPLARNPATCSTGLHLQTPSFCRLPSSPPHLSHCPRQCGPRLEPGVCHQQPPTQEPAGGAQPGPSFPCLSQAPCCGSPTAPSQAFATRRVDFQGQRSTTEPGAHPRTRAESRINESRPLGV